ncbi:PREDICTED: vegetative cell wall protein gp1-like [Camelina sativa]|uniref:Vegetative cell wall protein gp1-like n=1 Tax=Camelina sativa TaxID=90675 RepID=A0ABM0Z5A3_CAMSA|nr:PREDICTED: vegetative cell wall protein gp1-like [Camelina sativa]
MAKKLGFIVMLSMYLLLTVEFAHAQEDSPSPAVSPGHESLKDSSPLPPSSSPEADSPLPPSFSPEADSPQPPASSPEPLADSPSPSPPPPQPESPPAPSPSPSSPGQAPAPAPSDDDDDDDSDPETEYAPSPAPELGMSNDIKASDEGGDEFEDTNGEDSGMSGLKKAGIAIGTILGVGAIVIGALVYKKRRDNMARARYTYFTEGEFL